MTAHEAVQLIEASALFDAKWYVERYPDVKTSKMNPAEHFYKYGSKMMRDPSSQFSTAGYLAKHKDVKKNGMSPFLHYLRFGKKEGRAVVLSQDFSKKQTSVIVVDQAVSNNKSINVDAPYEKIAKQLEKTQALLEYYFSRCKELEYQSTDGQ